jgi:hypothetical protein
MWPALISNVVFRDMNQEHQDRHTRSRTLLERICTTHIVPKWKFVSHECSHTRFWTCEGSQTFRPPPTLSGNDMLEGVSHLWAAAFNPKAVKLRSGLLGVGSRRGTLVLKWGQYTPFIYAARIGAATMERVGPQIRARENQICCCSSRYHSSWIFSFLDFKYFIPFLWDLFHSPTFFRFSGQA